MRNTAQITEAEADQLISILEKILPVGTEIYVFGSRANWTAKDHSDLDLLVDAGRSLTLKERGHFEVALESSVLPFPVDLVDSHAINESFRDKINLQKIHFYRVGQSQKNTWKRRRLGDLIELKRGYDLASQDRHDGNVPIISSSGLSGKHSISKVKGPGVVTGRYGTIGTLHWIKEEFWPLNTTLYVRDFKRNNPRYIFYLLKTLRWIEFNDKSSVPGVNRNHVHEAFVPSTTDLAEQRAIANVLSALDDKIELNRRMNETLEGMAQAIFKDWFVDFGPVHRKLSGATDPVTVLGGLTQDPTRATKLAGLFPNSLGGDGLPEGWIGGTLEQLAAAISSTVDPATIDPFTPYIGLEHMPRQSIMLDGWGLSGSVSSNKTRFEKGQILFGKLRPYFHKVGIAAIDGVSSTDIVVLDARRREDRPFVTCCVSSEEFVAFTDKGSDGTKMPRTSWSKMKSYPIAVSPEDVRNAYAKFSLPLHDKIISSVEECRALVETRDYLLPKLMSGEVRVRDAEKAVADAS